MKKFSTIPLVLFIMISTTMVSQQKVEREHRIRKCQFPNFDTALLIPESKEVRFYQEIDSTKTIYTLKFKKDRLHYHFDLTEQGIPEITGFQVKEVDIPNETYAKIDAYLKKTFGKVAVRRILQQYPVENSENIEKTVKETFQNLMLPHTTYEFMVTGKMPDQERSTYEIVFDAEGELQQFRMALPTNYDHVLY
ncbi:hypothetical protein U1E44_13880 [Arenibacter sp. GZD96]|uniref:hypothetical protein n=1 Tax=Aurantibrevibacter litoralis TaxID=3106030 RepID=UPI002AFFB841|nr:hypothetical protein [Arenibacter sp. GZD-96]MEA1787186.1 hypothetical protein [Arenibacter sp. GZD-96]